GLPRKSLREAICRRRVATLLRLETLALKSRTSPGLRGPASGAGSGSTTRAFAASLFDLPLGDEGRGGTATTLGPGSGDVERFADNSSAARAERSEERPCSTL